MSLPSILEPNDLAPQSPKASKPFRIALPQAWKDRWHNAMSSPRSRRRLQIAGAFAAVGLGIGAYFVFRATPQPDYLNDPLDDLFNFTLLEDEFNQMPVEERLQLISKLVARLKNMSSNDSLLMAAFAGGVEGSARKQLEENASRLAIDVWDKYAKDYGKVGDDEKGEYLEKTFVEFSEMMESLGGEPRDIKPEERIADVKDQAAREQKRMTSADGPKPPGEMLGTAFEFMNGNVGGYANPQQKVRGQQMMRDMMRHFRGQDPSTGKPTGPG
ncbi:MAG: hypothetical protein PSX37_00895 [bacterium]|nr:hypothetical protein [bacterium]